MQSFVYPDSVPSKVSQSLQYQHLSTLHSYAIHHHRSIALYSHTEYLLHILTIISISLTYTVNIPTYGTNLYISYELPVYTISYKVGHIASHILFHSAGNTEQIVYRVYNVPTNGLTPVLEGIYRSTSTLFHLYPVKHPQMALYQRL